MTFEERIDPELAFMLADDGGPSLGELLKTDIAAGRSFFDERVAALAALAPPFEGEKSEYHVPGLENDPEVRVVEYSQRDMLYPDCAIIWLHGGGFLIGSAEDLSAQGFSALAPVISVDYRMAPETRAPAAARDACAVIEQVAKTRSPRKLVIGGPSAGGGLAASAALLNRDRGGPQLDFQLLIYPMLDDRHDTPSGHMDIPDTQWNRDMSLYAWSVYAEEDGASPYAAAARADDLSGLPPAYIMCGDLDLFLDEDLDYADRLRKAGVPVETAVFPGAPHAFNGFAPMAKVSQRANAGIRMALEHALA